MKKIPLTQGKVAIVDDEDYDRINKYPWRWSPPGYASRVTKQGGKHKTVLMHREVVNTPDGMSTDHINHDGLDNRRCNIRPCTHAENMRNMRLSKHNKSGYKGVSWNKARKKWVVCLSLDNKTIHLGGYFCLIRAAKVYDTGALKYYGEFAYLNFPLCLK